MKTPRPSARMPHLTQLRNLKMARSAHDLVRLALSLATAARGSDLPGVTTARMLEEMMLGYGQAFKDKPDEAPPRPSQVKAGMRSAVARTWKHLARERIESARPTIPLGKHFWALSRAEKSALEGVCASDEIHQLVTSLKGRPKDAKVELLDCAYWVKGCSSLGLLRYAALLGVGDKD